MTASEAINIIGRHANVAIGQTLRIQCTVVDVRQSFGRTDYLVTPLQGSGTQWISAERCILLEVR